MSDRLAVSLQENLLCIIAFNADHCLLVRNAVEPGLFASSVYKDLVIRCYEFIDQFGKPPAEHLPDLVEDILRGDDKDKAGLYSDLLESIDGLRTTINVEYVLNQLETFVRRQRLMAGLIRAHEQVEAGNLEEAEVIIEGAMRSRLALFHPGTTLAEGLDRLKAADNSSADTILLNIHELDKRLLGPTRKEMHLFIAPPKRGKSWWCTHVGKQALMQRWRVAHITLEMSEDRTAQRYLQTLYSLTRREAATQIVTKFEKDELGRVSSFHEFEMDKRPSMMDATTQKDVGRKLKKWRPGGNLIIKSFPTGSLTVPELKAYLDALERMHKFTPDLLIVDYPDLMKIDMNVYRHDVGRIFKELRGIAVERNLALVVPTQSNRGGANSKLVTDTNVSEDWSKIMICDVALTYSQTAEERKLGLARLYVSNGRNEEDKFAILLSQAYGIGQFALDSVWMADSYWALIDSAAKDKAGDDDD